VIMEAIILAGGKGSRLKSVVNDRPKPLADVNGRPFLEHLMDSLVLQGCSHFVLSVGYKGDMVKKHFGSSYFDVPISYAEEKKPLGTGGAAMKAQVKLKENSPFLIINGDTYFSIEIDKFIKFFNDTRADLAIALFPAQESGRYGRVQVKANGSIFAGFEEKAAIGEPANGGFFAARYNIFSGFKAPFKMWSLEADFMPELVKNGRKITGCTFEAEFFDIGLPRDYLEFCARSRVRGDGGEN
jgi:D-glycero-alpha-D-manno-heptose 1-phosphate guanylyltransferase